MSCKPYSWTLIKSAFTRRWLGERYIVSEILRFGKFLRRRLVDPSFQKPELFQVATECTIARNFTSTIGTCVRFRPIKQCSYLYNILAVEAVLARKSFRKLR